MQQKFEALNRVCLNNWHYIDRRVLSFSHGINFFTGHSGSGKSTVIDALQILLYANTDGRGFFNKAAADDSDRSLMEYLRGMVSIGDNNEYTYLRNHNFSSTIVMELIRTDTGEAQCIGVVFDVNTASNDCDRTFFWHKGALPEHDYRTSERAMTIEEVKDFIRNTYPPEEYYFEKTNERFRSRLYDVYLGGLDQERFPKLFKRAIPFKMNMKLSDFVKEYICMEQDISVEAMQESVSQYARMCRQIQDIREEADQLKEIQKAYDAYQTKIEEAKRLEYFSSSFGLFEAREREEEVRLKITNHQNDLSLQQDSIPSADKEILSLEQKKEELSARIASSGYEHLCENLENVQKLLKACASSEESYRRTADALSAWETVDVVPNQVLWDIEKFQKKTLSEEGIQKLSDSLKEIRQEALKQKAEADGQLRRILTEQTNLQQMIKELKQGKAAYPETLEQARKHIQTGLRKKYGPSVNVSVLADLIDVKDDTWRNAIEGYMASNKLMLVVPPEYTVEAMELCRTLDSRKFSIAAVLDTEQISSHEWPVLENALSEEVIAKAPYVQSYIDYLLGKVIKCQTIPELRRQQTGITSQCELYSGYKFQHLNPAQYTKFAYIGDMSRRQRIRTLEEQIQELEKERAPFTEAVLEAAKILDLEALSLDKSVYLGWISDMDELEKQKKNEQRILGEIRLLKEQNVEEWKSEKASVEKQIAVKKAEKNKLIRDIGKLEERLSLEKQDHQQKAEWLMHLEKDFVPVPDWEKELDALLEKRKGNGPVVYTNLRQNYQGRHTSALREADTALSRLRALRVDYLKQRPNRSFDVERLDNEEFAALLEKLSYKDLDTLHEKASAQAKQAVYFFKHDFVYKIRSAIKEALAQRDQLNRIISRMDFGKDRYRFVIERNHGADGRFYPVFMNEDLEINPSTLNDQMEHQMDLFSMAHEEHYGDLIQELLSLFLPPENATPAQLEEAKLNRQKYSDYRTYLSFGMEQIIQNEHSQINIKLEQMIRKNSGGEGQNPLYIILLASFVQTYRIELSPRLLRNPTIRLVVLDEAFSKMDAEKVAGCIALMRRFGFQAIISSTNDKIQSYLDSVDKTFVFANPNKRQISIAEFERDDFGHLREELEEESPS